MDLAECLHLQRADKGHRHIHHAVPGSQRRAGRRGQQHNLQPQHRVPPVKGTGAAVQPLHRLSHHDAGSKCQNGDQIPPRLLPLSLRGPNGQQDHVAGLGIGKNAAPAQIRIRVQQSAAQRQQRRRGKRLRTLKFPFFVHTRSPRKRPAPLGKGAPAKPFSIPLRRYIPAWHHRSGSPFRRYS